MICKKCGSDRPEKDFLTENLCYKCQYREKLLKCKKSRRCKQCRVTLQIDRWSYCSKECAEKGKKSLDKKYWTNLI